MIDLNMIIGNDKFNQIYDNKPEIDNKKEKRFIQNYEY